MRTGRRRLRSVVAVTIAVPVGLLHFVTGSHYQGPYPVFVNGYMIDILLPFAAYFLLVPRKLAPLRSWLTKGLLVFGVGASVEIAQFFGIPILGRTFDPLDFVMYGLGVALAVACDVVVFPRVFPSWRQAPELEQPQQRAGAR